jgi:hypothetical protein
MTLKSYRAESAQRARKLREKQAKQAEAPPVKEAPPEAPPDPYRRMLAKIDEDNRRKKQGMPTEAPTGEEGT